MTTKSQPRNNADTEHPRNAKRSLVAHSRLDELLVLATKVSFNGNVTMRIGSQDGTLGATRTVVEHHHNT